MENYVEPRLRRDFGGILSAYFQFLKLNMAGIFRAFLAYNGLFIGAFVLAAYLMVTGIAQVFATRFNQFNPTIDNGTGDAEILLGFGVILFIVILFVASMFNYALSSSYMSLYERRKENNIPRQAVWKMTRSNLGGLFLIAVAAVIMYIGYFIAQMVLSIIPFLGFVASLILGFTFNAILSMSIFSYFHNKDKNVIEAISEAFELLFSNYWRAVLVNFVLGLIIQISLMFLSIIPALITGVIIYHTVDGAGAFNDSVAGQFLLVFMLTLLCLLTMFTQMLSQTINAFLYFNLHEGKYNSYLQSRIMNLGKAV